nr:hypothetical protein [uncultured Actinoplanes sp.]
MVEILPGVGVAQVRVGDRRDEVEARLGPPHHPGRDSRAVYGERPSVVVTYAEDDTVEVVELSGGEEVFVDGVQLTHRFVDEVVADLSARGYEGEPIDAGHRFEAGFAILSTGSLPAADAPGEASRPMSGGVSVGPYECFRDPSDEDFRAHLAARQAERATA